MPWRKVFRFTLHFNRLPSTTTSLLASCTTTTTTTYKHLLLKSPLNTIPFISTNPNLTISSLFFSLQQNKNKNKNKMQIFVKNLSGKTITMEVNSNDTVASIKTKIQANQGVPMKEVGLIYGGKQLKDETTLGEYNIVKESTVEMVGKIKGGGFGTLDRFPPNLRELAQSFNQHKKICLKCYARLPKKATHCRKKKCGHSNQLREKHVWMKYGRLSG